MCNLGSYDSADAHLLDLSVTNANKAKVWGSSNLCNGDIVRVLRLDTNFPSWNHNAS